MENRIQKLFLWTTLLVGFLLGTFSQGIAQNNNTTLNSSASVANVTLIYTGPDTIYVGDDCTAPLDWGSPNSVSFVCNDPDCDVLSFDLLFIIGENGNYVEGDIIPVGEEVRILYNVQTNTDNVTAGPTVYFRDNTPPVFDPLNNPMDQTTDCFSSLPPVPPISDVSAVDNCPAPGSTSDEVTITYDGETTVGPGDCSGGQIIRTWTATDDYGNTSQYNQTITINPDNDPPVITGFPLDATQDCAAGGYASWLAAQRAIFAATDNGCGLAGLTDDAPATYDASCETLTVTFTATDLCGLTATTQAEFTVRDLFGPVITPPASNNVTLFCDGVNNPIEMIQNYSDNLTAVDNCGNITWSNNFTMLMNGCGGDTGEASVEYVAADDCGNIDLIVINFTVVDNTPPVWDMDPEPLELVCDQNVDIDAQIQAWLDNIGGGVASDQCSGNIVYGNNYTGLMPSCGNTGMVNVSFTARDGCGFTVIRIATVSVIDNQLPSIDDQAISQSVDCDDLTAISYTDWLATRGGATATDQCSPITDANWTTNIISDTPGCGTTFSRIVSFTVTDDCGNSATTTATYTLMDDAPPIIFPGPTDLTESCGGNDQLALNNWIDNIGGAIASDNCGNATWTSFDYTTSTGASGDNIVIGDQASYPQIVGGSCNFTVNLEWEVRDDCGNTAHTLAEFTLEDNQGPVFSNVPASTTVECNNVPGVSTPTVMDSCDPNPSVNFTELTQPGTCPGDFTLMRTWIATDACGNTNSAVQTITVADNTPPAFNNQPTNQIVSCNMVPPVAGVTITDSCDPDPEIVFSELRVNGSCDFNYTLTRSWVATDACGNQSTFNQTITVQDIEAPQFVGPNNITVSCQQGTNPADTGSPGAMIDNCDPTPTLNRVDVIIPGACANEFTIQRTWTAIDLCGNVSPPFVQTIIVTDEEGPSINSPAINESVDCTDPASAEAAFQFWIISNGNAAATDNCVSPNQLSWNAWVPGSYDLNNPATLPGTSVGVLDPVTCPSAENGVSQLESVDFVVFDNCGNGSVTNATFRVIDTQPPVFDNCPTSTLSFDATSGDCQATITLPEPQISESCSANDIRFSYSINNGPQIVVDPISSITRTLDVGNYIVDYYATDCAGNTAVCSFPISVNDLVPPMISCPADIDIVLGATQSCEEGVELTLPLPTTLDDNCSYPVVTQVQPAIPAERFITFAYDPDYQDYIAEDKEVIFTGLAANAVGTSVDLSVKIEGEADNPEAYFTVLGEDGTVLGTTEVGQPNVTVLVAGDCSANPPVLPLIATQIEIPTALYNSYAGDGALELTLVANRNFAAPAPGMTGDGINPICTTFSNGTPDGQTDGSSMLSVQLDVEKATPYYFTTGATTIPPTTMQQPAIAPTIEFEAGVTEVFYVVNDIAGNSDSCSFTVTIEDNVPPVAICEPITILINPSGLSDYELQPFEVDNGSFDNCSIVEYTVFPNVFTCDQVGQVFQVTLTVKDAMGNEDSCIANVAVAIDNARPNFAIEFCGNDDLSLFANPPFDPAGGASYTYEWSGPNMFSSTDADPVIVGATSVNSGIYTVTVTGTTGCTSVGTVAVEVNDAPDMPIIMSNGAELCENEDLVLTTQGVSGFDVAYDWYAGIWPGGTFITSTTDPTYTLSPPQVTNTFFVIVRVDGCTSAASTHVLLTANPIPTASVNDDMLEVCSGEMVSLGSPTTGTNLTYQWTGPNGFSSTDQNPADFATGVIMSGDYSLVVTANGCSSNPATTTLVVNPIPATPILSVDNSTVCAGESVTFTTNITDGTLYTWTLPDMTTVTTTTNTLDINNLTTSNGGSYSVMVSYGDCNSEVSTTASIFVESLPVIIASNDGPSCGGENIQLLATDLPNATYEWRGPANEFISNNQNPIINATGGTYTVIVTSSNNCQSMVATEVVISEIPTIVDVSNNGLQCVTGAADINLTATINPTGGSYTYQWTGPNGFASADASPTIPNATASNNGSYNLIVTNSDGCVSTPMTTVIDVQDAPNTPNIFGDLTICEGEALTLTTDGVTGTMVEYSWQTPSGIVTTPVPSLTIFPANAANSGAYSLIVTMDGCTSNSSGISQISVIEQPAPPAIVGPATICEGTSLQLSTELITGATYEWTGPAGFDPGSVHNPVIFNVSDLNEGAYSVRIILGNCASEVSTPFNIIVNESPEPPTIFGGGPVCISDENAEAVFSIVPSSATAGATYTWFQVGTNQQVFGPSNALTFTMRDFTGFTDGIYEFYAVATASGCSSLNSAPVSFEFNTIPENNAFAGTDIAVCGGSSVNLDAVMPSIGTGVWTQVSGPSVSIANPGMPNTVINGLADNETYVLVWTLSNGICGDYSSDDVLVTVDVANGVAEAGDNIESCNPENLFLNAVSAGAGTQGTWTQSDEQASQGITFADPTNPNTAILGMENGTTYSFTWTLSNAGCGEFSNDLVVVEILPGAETAFAGNDAQSCGDGTVLLEASPINGNTGLWTTNNPDITIVSPTNASTIVNGVIPGDYTFTWTVDAGICGTSSDEVVITYAAAPEAEADMAATEFGQSISIRVVANDITANGVILTIEEDPTNGTVIVGTDGSVEYTPDPAFAGEDEFVYMICSRDCPDECSEAIVTVVVGADAPCNVPTIITPNGDNTNDHFIIPCLATDDYPDNQLIIYNQWGDEVFRSKNYQNDWSGTYNGENLPVGTYFWLVDFNKGEKPSAGFLVIER